MRPVRSPTTRVPSGRIEGAVHTAAPAPTSVVQSCPMLAAAALPIATWPRLPPPVTGVETSGVGPRCWPKSNDHWIEPWLALPPGGETAYMLPVTAVV